MTYRFQFIKHPKTSVLQTPEQAYLIIEGVSTYHNFKNHKTRSKRCCSTSTSSVRRHYERLLDFSRKQLHKYNKQNEYENGHRENKKRVKRCDSQQECRKCQNSCRQSVRQSSKKENNKDKNTNMRAFSFRNQNLTQPNDLIVCNYEKRVEQQNLLLRKQNKFLQQYVQVLQQKNARPSTTRAQPNPTRASRNSKGSSDQFGQNTSTIGIGSFIKKNSQFQRTNSGDTQGSGFHKNYNRDDDIYNMYRKR